MSTTQDTLQIHRLKQETINKAFALADDTKFIIKDIELKIKRLEEKRDNEENYHIKNMYNKDILRCQRHIIAMLEEISEYYDEIDVINKEIEKRGV